MLEQVIKKASKDNALGGFPRVAEKVKEMLQEFERQDHREWSVRKAVFEGDECDQILEVTMRGLPESLLEGKAVCFLVLFDDYFLETRQVSVFLEGVNGQPFLHEKVHLNGQLCGVLRLSEYSSLHDLLKVVANTLSFPKGKIFNEKLARESEIDMRIKLNAFYQQLPP